jgi:uncharacterized protein DUF4129
MSVRLRPRNAWEALDLGFALVREHARRVYGTWVVVYAPVLALALAIFPDRPVFAWLMVWWLKPLFDRVVLEVLSAEIFEVRVPIRTLLRRLPALAWRSGVVGALLWRRFDLARSLHLPVYQLERLSGRAARSRIRVLDRDGRGAAIGLLLVMASVDLMFAVGAAIAIAFLVDVQTPVGTLIEAWFQGTFSKELSTVYGVILAGCSASVIEPLYVACGFTLYLQRRTALEGWDIELRFRQLAGRVESAQQRFAPAALAGVLVALALAAASIAPSPARAADARAQREIQSVLADPEFGHESRRKGLTYVGPTWKPDDKPSKPIDWAWLEMLQGILANAGRALAWATGIVVAVYALYHTARYVRLHGFRGTPRERPQFLFGLDVRPESLPADVPGTALALVDGSRLREALSLLYRASLVRFMEAGLEFLQGDTEGDCMRRVTRGAQAPRREYFERLVAAWQQLAYGHQPVPAELARGLARQWPEVFANAAASPPAGTAPEAKAA